MADEFRDDTPAEERPVREGEYDAQLALPLSPVRVPEPLAFVIKRDGRREAFDRAKISDAIFRAAESIGGTDRDRARNLASAVSIYLSKQTAGHVPTVDQVHDAVERVLMSMGHMRTALAYARYRDRRARIRQMRAGDLRAFMGELEEARHERESLGGHPGGGILARVGDTDAAQWDRDRTTAALARETGLDRATADLVAAEVEDQIHRAGFRALTGALIRELVDAALIARGLGAHRERHRRLGVPLLDAERILSGIAPDGPVRDPDLDHASPHATDLALARAVKREYALAQVFSAPVTEAHLRGDLHLAHAGLVDRLYATVQTLEPVIRRGIGVPGTREFAAPARRPETLLAHLIKCTAMLEGYFAESIVWDDLNIFLAPFLHDLAEKDLRQFAQMLVYEFAYRAVMAGNGRRPTRIALRWTVPQPLRRMDALGPGGRPLSRTYGDFEHTAQQLAWAILEILRRGGVNGGPFPGPVPRVHLDRDFFAAPGHEEFLHQAARLSADRRCVEYLPDRSGAGRGPLAPGHPAQAYLHQIALNLPRAAITAGSEDALFRLLPDWVGLAIRGHHEKRRFLTQLALHPAGGPLGLLTISGDGRPFVDIDSAACRVALDGLDACVRQITGQSLNESDAAEALGMRIVEAVRLECEAQAGVDAFRFVACQNDDPAVSRRFAALDLKDYPAAAAALVDEDPATQELRYTTGVRLRPGHGLSPLEAARVEGRFHQLLHDGACSVFHLPDTDPYPEAIADFLVKVYRATENRAVTLV